MRQGGNKGSVSSMQVEEKQVKQGSVWPIQVEKKLGLKVEKEGNIQASQSVRKAYS